MRADKAHAERVEDDQDVSRIEPDKRLNVLIIVIGAAMAIAAMIPIWITLLRV